MRRITHIHASLIALLASTAFAAAQNRVTPPQNPDTGQINRGAGEATRPPTGAPPGAMQQSAPGGQVGDVQSPKAMETTGAAPPSGQPASQASAQPMGPIGATGQTMPSLFSERNAQLDRVPLAALVLDLKPEQKEALFAAVADQKPGPAGAEIAPATLIPDDTVLAEFPAGVAEQIPSLKGYKYFRAGDKIVLVSAPNRIAVAVIEH
jgi:hypothetical protein